MFTKIIYIIIYIIVTLSLSQIITLGSHLLCNKKIGSTISKNICYNILPIVYQHGFNSPIYYNGLYKKTMNIDIIISNHINILDFMINISILRQFDDRDIYFIIKKELVFIPATGFILLETDIILNRKIEDDIQNLVISIKKIKSGIIVLFPEGTRYTKKKHIDAKKYSIDNNLTVYNNMLYPKMKGLWTICNVLIKEKRLGNIIDITTRIENFKNIEFTSKKLFTHKFGNTYSIINSYSIPIINNYDDFKQWFLKIWDKKDNILDIILTKNDKFDYKKVKSNIKSSDYILLVFIVTLFIYVCVKTNGLYLLFSLIISYIITIIKYIKINK